MTKPSFWSRRIRTFRRHLIAGVIVTLPLAATAFVLLWIFRLLDGLLGDFIYPWLERLTGWTWIENVPGLGILVLTGLLVLVGWIAEQAIGSRVVSAWNTLLERIPVMRRIYGAANRIVRTVFGQGARPFNTVVLVEYPSAGRWSMGFLAAAAPDLIKQHIEDAVSVFVPTTPNPTSGFIVIVPRSRIIVMPITIDQAFTYILSGGAVRDAVPLPAMAHTGKAAQAPLDAEPERAESTHGGGA